MATAAAGSAGRSRRRRGGWLAEREKGLNSERHFVVLGIHRRAADKLRARGHRRQSRTQRCRGGGVQFLDVLDRAELGQPAGRRRRPQSAEGREPHCSPSPVLRRARAAFMVGRVGREADSERSSSDAFGSSWSRLVAPLRDPPRRKGNVKPRLGKPAARAACSSGRSNADPSAEEVAMKVFHVESSPLRRRKRCSAHSGALSACAAAPNIPS